MRDGNALGLLLGAVAGVAGTLATAGMVLAEAAQQPHGEQTNGEQVIRIVARRFSYAPNEIVLQRGQPVVLEFTSKDFVHGFKIPELDIRADLPPGKITRVRVTPEKSGVYEFLCDNFCGSGHEEMSGRIVVRD